MKPQNVVVRSTSTTGIPISKIWEVVKKIAGIPIVKKGLTLAGSWIAEKVIKKVFTKKKKEAISPPINNHLNLIIMDKGIFSDKAQTAIIEKVKVLLKDQKAAVVLLLVLALKILFLYVDDTIAETKLPQELTDKLQAFFDAILVTKDPDLAMALGVELIPLIWALFKKDPAVVVTEKL
jgi:hypothetical protein